MTSVPKVFLLPLGSDSRPSASARLPQGSSPCQPARGAMSREDCAGKIGSKQQKCIYLRFWRPGIQNQGVGRVNSFWRLEGDSSPCLFLASGGRWRSLVSLGCRGITPVSASVFTWPSFLFVCVPALPLLSLLRTLAIGFRAHPNSPGQSLLEIFNLVIFAKNLFSK